MGKQANKGKSFGQIASEVGLMNLATKGLGTRVLMIGAFILLHRTVHVHHKFLLTGTLTGFQWWIYDSFKTAMGMGTTGGK